MTDITMNLNDTLELDAIIEEWLGSDSVIDFNGDKSSFTVSGFQTKTTVLDPEEIGTYTITINGQEITVDVIGELTLPESVDVDTQYNINEGSGSVITDSKGSTDATLNGIDWKSKNNAVGDYVLEGSRSTSEYAETNSSNSISNWTMYGWIYAEENNKYDQILFIGDQNGKTEGHRLSLDSNNGNLLTTSGNGSSDDIEPTTNFVSNNNWGFFALSHNNSLSNEKRLITWSTDSEISDHSYSSDYTPSGSYTYKIGGYGGKPTINGFYDYFGFKSNGTIQKSDLESIWKNTKDIHT